MSITRPGFFAGTAALLAISLLPVSARAASVGTSVAADGYTFTNINGPNSGTAAGAGTNINGIANDGAAVGFDITNNGSFSNFVRNPNGSFTPLSLTPGSMAFGINSAGDVVGQQNGNAVFVPPGGTPQNISIGGTSSTAFGINDKGSIVGQFVAAASTPGFVANSNLSAAITLNAPSGPNVVNAQGINNNGQVVGFYVGNDGQDHGFMTNVSQARNGILTGTAVGDPTIPSVPGEPGATFVFSQILGVNDSGIAVGYYGDSTTSQHGFLYDTLTGVYTFLDDPAEQFDDGVEVTQITGITNSDEIAGFYSDASGVFHGFVACPSGVACGAVSATPEPGSLALAGIGFVAAGAWFRQRRKTIR